MSDERLAQFAKDAAVTIATAFDEDHEVAPEPWTTTGIAAVGLKVGEFYYCVRELVAGRPCPLKLTDEQRAYIDDCLARST